MYGYFEKLGLQNLLKSRDCAFGPLASWDGHEESSIHIVHNRSPIRLQDCVIQSEQSRLENSFAMFCMLRIANALVAFCRLHLPLRRHAQRVNTGYSLPKPIENAGKPKKSMVHSAISGQISAKNDIIRGCI